MNQRKWILMSSLQLFAEGGNGGEGSDTGVIAGDAAPQNSQGVKASSGPSGREASDAGVQETPVSPDTDREFEALIQGKYKEAYDQRVQEIIRKRLKSLKGESQPTPERGQAEADPPGIRDPGFAGQLREAAASRQYADWMRQAEEAGKRYPGMDLRTECRNPRFLELLGAGVDVGSAYLVSHQDEIIPAIMGSTARIVEQKLVGKLRTEGIRPPENGLRPQGTTLTKTDVAKLSKTEREEIRRRVAKGERIRF